MTCLTFVMNWYFRILTSTESKLLGLLQVDLFASRFTHQLPNYVSWHPDPGAIACDAFAQDWSLHHTSNYKEPSHIYVLIMTAVSPFKQLNLGISTRSTICATDVDVGCIVHVLFQSLKVNLSCLRADKIH